ncbi:1712_t:CDS:1 [Paraglomus occultum]|uniref:1712_t:CDS:1 n=1 Tax=Paraglomus occultum TaxID=144539 RepID=A0A9N9FR97_9GLOM|nr:1712_t:CDS:1 [Paraglomus occultum]
MSETDNIRLTNGKLNTHSENRNSRIMDQISSTRRNRQILCELSATIVKQLEMTRYAEGASELSDRIKTLEDTLNSFFKAQEDCIKYLEISLKDMQEKSTYIEKDRQKHIEYIKYLEVSLKDNKEKCVKLNEKCYKAANQCRDLEMKLNVTKKSPREASRTHSNGDMRDYRGDNKEIMAELQRKKEEILYYQREIKAFDERFAHQVQINERNQLIIDNCKCKFGYGTESENEIISLRQQKQTLEQQLREARNSNVYLNAYQNEKAERRHSEDSFRREFQQMQQRVKDAEARASELQRKNNLLKEEVTNYRKILDDTTNLTIQSENEETKEFVAGPSRCDPLAMENKVLRDQNVKLEKRLQETRTTAKTRKVKTETRLENLKVSFLHEFRNMQQSFEAKTSELQNLLNNEVTSIKAALGDTINVSWGDSDEDQLVKDINKLQISLKEFTQLKGRQTVIDQRGASALLQRYDCRLDPTKLTVSGALQRFVIENVLKYTNSYFNKCIENLEGKSNNELEQNIEADSNYFLEGIILNTASSLKLYIKEFAERRKGEDELTRTTGVKICQQVYAILGNRGFAPNDHTFLVDAVKHVLNELEKCRQIKDESKKKDIEELAPSVIREMVRIFYFKFQTQVPVVEYHFFESGAKFDPTIMECSQDDDGEVEKLVVDICSFPLIGVNISDEQERRIFNKAKVQLRPGFSG